MRRMLLIILALALALPVAAWGPDVRPVSADTGREWTAEYFNNRYLAGMPVFVRLDNAIAFDWGSGSPVPGLIPQDNFSVRWTGPQQFVGGTYTFSASVDDGIRVYVNDQLVIDSWIDQVRTTHSGTITLNPGTYWVRVEYYEGGDQAAVFLTWRTASAQTAPGGWAAEYYNNTSLVPPQAAGRLEPSIDYNWGGSSPIPGVINADNFSARWWGFPELEGGRYRFTAGADDGVRVFVDGQTVIDSWIAAPYSERTGTVDLAPGVHTIKVEYFEAGDQARIQVYWVREGAGSGVLPQRTTATVNTGRLNVRTGPGVGNSIMTTVSDGDIFSAIGRNAQSTWVQISGDGFTGWVSASYIVLSGDINSLPVAEGSSGGITTSGGLLYAQSNASLRIRRGPSTNTSRIAALQVGERALVIGRTSNSAWLQIRKDDGVEGWVSNSFITLVGDAPLTSIPITG